MSCGSGSGSRWASRIWRAARLPRLPSARCTSGKFCTCSAGGCEAVQAFNLSQERDSDVVGPACRERFAVFFACSDGKLFVVTPVAPFGEHHAVGPIKP